MLGSCVGLTAKDTGKTAVVPVLGCVSFPRLPVRREAMVLREGARVVGKENGLMVFAPEREVSQDVGVTSSEVSVSISPGADFL